MKGRYIALTVFSLAVLAVAIAVIVWLGLLSTID